MSTHIDALRLRAVMGREYWMAPQPYGPEGWLMRSVDAEQASVIATAADHDDGTWWLHASIAKVERIPSYEDLVLLHRAAFGDGYAFQVFVPADEHINIHPHALHLFGRLDGERPACIPDFGKLGTI